MDDKPVYHYTIGPKLPVILQDGALKPTTSAGNRSPRELAILWFSTDPYWEASARKKSYMIVGGVSEEPRWMSMADHEALLLVRFATSRGKLLPWPEIADAANMPKETRLRLEANGRDMGANPSCWYGITGSVSLYECYCEIHRGGKWLPAAAHDLVDEWNLLQSQLGFYVKSTVARAG